MKLWYFYTIDFVYGINGVTSKFTTDFTKPEFTHPNQALIAAIEEVQKYFKEDSECALAIIEVWSDRGSIVTQKINNLDYFIKREESLANQEKQWKIHKQP